jgi:hypothetical protein
MYIRSVHGGSHAGIAAYVEHKLTIAAGLAWIFALLSGVNSLAVAGESALSSLTPLPAEDRSNLARIERPEGNPRPERWRRCAGSGGDFFGCGGGVTEGYAS